MDSADALVEDDWLGVCRRSAERVRAALKARPTVVDRAEETGDRGGGGDHTLVIDREAEEAVLDELCALHDGGTRFTALSEERGEVDFGDADVRVVIDPIDGSMNAKRGLTHHALSIAVADGPTVGDVCFGYVFDLGATEEWVARRGEGAWMNGVRLDPALSERRARDGRLEVLAIESADPRLLAASLDGLLDVTYRLRALGAIALSLCQVAAGRVDGMVSLRACRSFDAAAGALVVREAGGLVSFPQCAEALGAPLDLEPRSPVVAARSAQTLSVLEGIPA
ncbi:MAG: monophosphatase [Solirubrobacteraceae bacterium]|jgi:myo-inositol-1(or 4)-monophosphatase|nr:monophosphatase [Solirubrobacteraceae bacterium]